MMILTVCIKKYKSQLKPVFKNCLEIHYFSDHNDFQDMKIMKLGFQKLSENFT